MKFFSILGVVLLIATVCQANILRVPSQYSTIQEAINISNAGDTILVAAGVYAVEADSVHVAHFIHKMNVCMISEEGREETILDAENTIYHSPLRFIGSHSCLVKGFTLTNGHSNVYVYNSSNIVITECTISNAEDHGIVTGDGTAVDIRLESNSICNNRLNAFYSEFVELTAYIIGNDIYSNGKGVEIRPNDFNRVEISSNRIFGNLSDGIYFSHSPDSLFITANQIYRNGGTGIYIAGDHSPSILSNTITNNEYAGIQIEPWSNTTISSHIKQNIIALNAYAGVIAEEGSNLSFECNDVWNNHFNYLGYLPDQTGINGNIALNPFFCGQKNDDYSVARNSPVLVTPCGVMGALQMPGCDEVSTKNTSWGKIKNMKRK
jgi:parallel beta-helix repeat protein